MNCFVLGTVFMFALQIYLLLVLVVTFFWGLYIVPHSETWAVKLFY